MRTLAIITALVLVNLATVLAFAIDKQRAIAGEWRVRESTLLTLAAFGGAAGACWARSRFRHKTRKQPFTTILDLIAMAHAGVAAGLGVLIVLPA